MYKVMCEYGVQSQIAYIVAHSEQEAVNQAMKLHGVIRAYIFAKIQ